MSLFQPRALEQLDRGAVPIINDNFRKLFRLLTGGVDFANTAASGLLQTWQDSVEDNMDNSNLMTIDIYLPSETRKVHKTLLRLRKKQYRADSTGASSGGGSTSGSGGSYTATSGASMTGYSGAHDHDINNVGGTTGETSGHTHSYVEPVGYTESSPDHNHTTPAHEHSIPEHTHSTPNHTHNISYAINLLTLPSDAVYTVTINGTNRTTVLGGPWAGNVDELDITEYMQIGQWNTISIGCGTGVRVRTSAQIFIQAFIEPVGRLYPDE